MHRDVWEFHNGLIPDGYVVHHKDEDKSNNRIENLELMSAQAHGRKHAIERWESASEEERQKRVANINRASELAKAWHSSKEGRAWHSKHAKSQVRKKVELKCTYCGKNFLGIAKLTKRGFCSMSCQSGARTKSGIDDEERNCVSCGKIFRANKYKKTKTCSKNCWREALRGTRKTKNL